MSDVTADEPATTRTERHASRAELFFDLVAAVGSAGVCGDTRRGLVDDRGEC